MEEHIKCIYERLKESSKEASIYKPINTIFPKDGLINIDGNYCFADAEGYHYLSVERGSINEDRITQSLFEITYWVLEDHILTMAFDYERKHRINGQDSRRLAFAKEIQLFELAGKEYAARAKSEIKEILAVSPFQDGSYK